jgi:hypothetical protein
MSRDQFLPDHPRLRQSIWAKSWLDRIDTIDELLTGFMKTSSPPCRQTAYGFVC